MTDGERIDFLERQSISVSASSQRGYRRYQLVQLRGSPDQLLLVDTNEPLRDAIDAAEQRLALLPPREET